MTGDNPRPALEMLDSSNAVISTSKLQKRLLNSRWVFLLSPQIPPRKVNSPTGPEVREGGAKVPPGPGQSTIPSIAAQICSFCQSTIHLAILPKVVGSVTGVVFSYRLIDL